METSVPTISQLLNKSITIRTRRLGILTLRPLTLGDIEFIEKLGASDITARDFIVRTIHHQIESADWTCDDIAALSNRVVARIGIAWVRQALSLEVVPVRGTSTFELMKSSLLAYQYRTMSSVVQSLAPLVAERQRHVAQLLRAIVVPNVDYSRTLVNSMLPAIQAMADMPNQYSGIVASTSAALLRNRTELSKLLSGLNFDLSSRIAEAVRPVLQPGKYNNLLAGVNYSVVQEVSSSAQQLAAAISSIDFGISHVIRTIQEALASVRDAYTSFGVISAMPQVRALLEQWEKLRDAAAHREGILALDASGFGFTEHLWTVTFVASFAQIDMRVRSAVVTNRMATYTRSPEFASELSSLFLASPTLFRRWRIVESALTEHKQRNYLASVRMIIPEVEGIIGDMLLLNGVVASKGTKLYLKDGSGGLRKDKKGNPIHIYGLRKLLDHAGFDDHEVLQTVKQLVRNRFADARNNSLHGRDTNYDQARLSVQTFLLLLVLAMEIVEFENILSKE